MVMTAFNGLCMAIADSVPGVSGSTIAFILGFYDRLIGALHDLLDRSGGRQKGQRKRAALYLCQLGAGWVIGMACCVRLLSRLFEKNIYLMSSLFIGLTIAAMPFIIREEKDSLQGHWKNIPFAVLGAGLVVLITLLRSDASAAIDLADVHPLNLFYLGVVGMVAISAMILPGISGSTVLLIAGAYLPIIYALRDLMHGQLSALPGLIALEAGILIGIALIIHLVRLALQRHRSMMIYLILGLMAGSVYAILMGPTTLRHPVAALSPSTFNLFGFLLGIMILLGLQQLRKFSVERPSRRMEGDRHGI